MRLIPLTPYKCNLVVCSREEFERRFGIEDGTIGCSKVVGNDCFVWAKDRGALVHELAHAVLSVFHTIGSDPREASGEPFCYLLEYAYREAVK